MKSIALASIASMFLLACAETPGPTVESKESVDPVASKENMVSYVVDTTQSLLNWEGYEGLSLGKAEHYGTVDISHGEIHIDETSIVAGEIKFDINSIAVKDIPSTSSKNGKLTRHLLSEDFFDANKFPEARFVITGIERKNPDSVTISGNLTLKGTEKNISFNAAAKITDSLVTAVSPVFYINRKDWGMHYRSENSLGDELIRPEIGIAINVVARKK
jgi:polyisoprenoid-binding protein YceI